MHDHPANRRTALATFASLAALAAGCVTRPTDPSAAIAPRGTLAMDDRTMAMQAAGAGLYEVEAGRLAVARSAQPAVRDFGQLLVQHHGAAGAELNAILGSHGLTVPVRLPPQFDLRLARLASEPAPSFDAHFVQMVGMQDHRAQVAFFQHGGLVAQDAALRGWFLRHLPVLRQHLQLAQALAGTLGG